MHQRHTAYSDVDFGNPESVSHDYAVDLRMLGKFKSRFAPDDFVLCFDEKYAKLRVSFVFSSCLCLFGSNKMYITLPP